MEFREKVMEFNRRAAQAREDGYEVMCGKVYVKETLDNPNAFTPAVCSVLEYYEDQMRKIR